MRDLRRVVLPAILLLAALIGGRDILDEGSGMPIGDMPRYLMNGVFLYDLIAAGGAWRFDELVQYAERYYAQYPALSLGHHPPLLYVSLVPFYAIFGINVFSARLASVAFFLVATWGLYAVVNRVTGTRPAVWAAVLFLTNVYVVRFGQYTLSEMPMLALILVALNALLAYGDSRKPVHFAWFVVAASASLYAKQHAVFAFPLYGLILWLKVGWRGLLTRHVLAWTAVGAFLSIPAVVMALVLSPGNVGVVTWNLSTLAAGEREESAIEIAWMIVRTHVSYPVAAASLAGFVVLWTRRPGLAAMGLLWIVVGIVSAVVATGPVEPTRYSFVAIPAYFYLAGQLAMPKWTSPVARILAVAVLGFAVIWQVWLVRGVRPVGSGGYEDVARFVVQHGSTPVLYDSPTDTGFFVFFVRKHDSTGNLIVLRAEKLFAAIDDDGQAYVSSREDIPPLLKRYGVRYVVTEDRIPKAPLRQQLREALLTGPFVERLRVPIRSRLPQTQGIDLVVYEFLEAGPPDLDAELHIGLPVAGRDIRLRLRDLYK